MHVFGRKFGMVPCELAGIGVADSVRVREYIPSQRPWPINTIAPGMAQTTRMQSNWAQQHPTQHLIRTCCTPIMYVCVYGHIASAASTAGYLNSIAKNVHLCACSAFFRLASRARQTQTGKPASSRVWIILNECSTRLKSALRFAIDAFGDAEILFGILHTSVKRVEQLHRTMADNNANRLSEL